MPIATQFSLIFQCQYVMTKKDDTIDNHLTAKDYFILFAIFDKKGNLSKLDTRIT